VKIGWGDASEIWFSFKQDDMLGTAGRDCSIVDLMVVGLQDGVWRFTERTVAWK
jgi:hypothetical protein